MVHSRGRPTAGEWTDIREEFEHMYLKQNLTLNTIKDHFSKRGFVATDRQYKTKVKAWDLDRKKIKAPTWHSMFIVMKERNRHGESSVFVVPIRGDHREVVRSDRIIKQINRDRTEFDGSNLNRAYEILREAGVQILTDEEAVRHEHLPASHWTDRSQVLLPSMHSPTQAPVLLDDPAGGSSTDSTSPLSSHSMANNYTMNFGLDSLYPLSATGQTMSSSSLASSSKPLMPFLQSSTTGLHHPTYGSQSGILPTSPTATVPPVLENSSAMEILFFDRSCSNLQGSDATQQAHLLKNLSLFVHTDDERSLAVKWTAPYLQALLKCHKPCTQPLWRQGEKEGAKDAFRLMLKRSNKYIFPYSNWMVTVLASNSQTVLLTEFLSDCCDVIDHDDQAFRMFYGSSLYLTLALYTNNHEGIERYRFGFINSMQTIRMIWSERSENYLVNQCYLAWLMLEQGRGQEAVEILTQSLPETEDIVGRQHVVTLNCLTILARALAETGRLPDAISVLKDVSDRLKDCAAVLQAYRYRQILRLADYQIQTGDDSAAESNLKEVVHFRSNRFGMDASVTRRATDTLAEFLTKRGRHEEAHQLLERYEDRYNQIVVNR